MVTEVGTGLGMLGAGSLDDVLSTRPPAMHNLSPEDWDALSRIRSGGSYDAEFHAAWENGRAFLAARAGLRGRVPETVEWKGAVRAPGDEVAPIDLRVDHVFLISCKYLSNILFNVAPAHVFDHLLVGGAARARREANQDWYGEVAPDTYQRLYEAVRLVVSEDGDAPATTRPAEAATRSTPAAGAAQSLPGLEEAGPDRSGAAVAGHDAAVLGELPRRAVDLTPAHRSALAKRLGGGWPAEAKAVYEELSHEVAQASAARWRAALSGGKPAAEAMLWRLLRIGATPYFVLGSSAARTLRLRIATSWDWRQLFVLDGLEIFDQRGGQPRVGWTATVHSRAANETHQIAGHVEVRWSHGRFGAPPEAKGYLDTAHHLVPGYFALQ
jgi:hypothetical protein